jgi:hypothetical protein
MKKIYAILKIKLLILPLLFIFNNASAQFCTTPTQTVGIFPTLTTQTTTAYTGAICFTFNATQGCGYFFSTCNLSSADTYLYLYNGIGGTNLGGWDDQCGVQSQFTWVCPTTGVYSVLMAQFVCSTLGSSTSLSYSTTCASVPCSGTPSSNTAIPIPTTQVCPGSSGTVALATTYTNAGITFQWMASSTSSVGPWTTVTTGTNQTLVTPTLAVPAWYNCVITCTNSTSSVTTNVAGFNVASTTTNTAPYYENFEGVGLNDQLPNCSWKATAFTTNPRTYTSAQNQNRVPRSGTKFAAFYYSPGNTNYFWSNGIWLDAGVTYSASLWYTTEYYGYTNWTDLSILYGTAQSSTGLTPIVSSNGAAVSPVYKSLSNTFAVTTSGLYYIAIRGTSNGSCCGYNLSWDDLAIEIPCAANPVTVAVSAPSSSICQGNSVTLVASGANTYTWNTGVTGASLTAAPNSNISYVVTGTSSLTGCTATFTQNVIVNPSPIVSIFADKINICKGKSATLFAYGANTYNWSTLSNSTQIVVSPTTTTTYTVIGTNAFGCTGQAVQQVSVMPQPNVTAAGTSTSMCVGETVTLQASGASTYQWLTNAVFIQGAQAIVSPNATTNYTLTGIDANGCSNTSNITVQVNLCTGINTVANNSSDIKVFPNPSKGEFVIEMGTSYDKSVEVVDFTGKVVYSTKTNNAKINVNINNYAAGVYYVKVMSNGKVDVVKVVKD